MVGDIDDTSDWLANTNIKYAMAFDNMPIHSIIEFYLM